MARSLRIQYPGAKALSLADAGKDLKTWGLPCSDNSSLLEYRQKLERVMKFDNDPKAGRRGEFEKSLKEGWFLGSESFKAKLDDLAIGRTQKDTFR